MSASDLDLVIKGNLVLAGGIVENGQVGVRDGVVIGLFDGNEPVSATEEIDASGRLVFPGIVDAHVHSYSIPTEGFEHSTPAAAAGGVTTIIEMPYDITGKQSDPERFAKKIDLISRSARVDVALLATIEKQGPLDKIAPLVEMGACGFKLSVNEADPVRFPRIAAGVLWNVLPVIAEQGVTVGFHAENEELINFLVDRLRKEGRVYPLAHCLSRPSASETLAVLELLELAYWTRCRLHLYHTSLPRSVQMIEIFRRQGVDVSVETCPHYLILHEDDMERLGAFAKINPPIRSRQCVEEMWELVKADKIDMLTSDHAPWPLERKQAEVIFDNGSGAPGVETIFPLLYSEGVVKRGLSPLQLARMLCEAPARRFNLHPRKGRIALGADADFAILDPAVRWTVRGAEMRSSAGWTPYEGMEVQGRVVRTLLRGRTVYDGQEVTAKPGYGVFVPGGRLRRRADDMDGPTI
jgi:allantoinase